MKDKNVKEFIKKITDDYKETSAPETNKVDENIKRYTKLTMAPYVEDEIARFIRNILKDREYNYLIDAQLSTVEGIVRPDIMVYDNDNIIHAIIEVKSSLGWLTKEYIGKYEKKMENIKNSEELEITKINHKFKNPEKKDPIYTIVVLTDHTHPDNVKYLGKDYYVLFHDWYDKISEDSINHDPKRGMEAFINRIKEI